MTINNWEVYKANLWDWGFLNGCFGQTKIRVTDVDGCVERRGRFLIIETKSVGVEVSDGQRRMLEALRRTMVFTILIVWGAPGQPTCYELWTRHARHGRRSISLPGLISLVSRWFAWAESQDTR